MLALTIDDGTDSAVAGAYLDFIVASGIRMTFFPNGVYPSWTPRAPGLRPLVESGPVQVFGATSAWSRADLRTLPDRKVASQISRDRLSDADVRHRDKAASTAALRQS